MSRDDATKLACVLPVADLAGRIVQHKSAGETVVFANGCFDILHVGHLRYLLGARELGDVLVVGVNADASVRQLKGSGRPIVPDRERAELLAGFGCVDYVTIFDELDVGELLRKLMPDIHAKGTDYTTESVPERHVAAELGIRVAITGDAKTHATRDLLQQIADAGRA